MELEASAFEIELYLFDPYKEFTEETGTKLREIMKYEGTMKIILQKAVDKLPGMKRLDRAEHGISTIDEKKQLRVRWWLENLHRFSKSQSRSPHAIYFANYGEENFTLSEMKNIASIIKKEIEEIIHDDREIISNVYYSESFGDNEQRSKWYILERQEKMLYDNESWRRKMDYQIANGLIEYNCEGMWQHRGYVNVKFNSKEKAAAYYDKHYPLMRQLNARNNWCSDWNPSDNFRYVVRRYNNEILTISPVKLDDTKGVGSHM